MSRFFRNFSFALIAIGFATTLTATSAQTGNPVGYSGTPYTQNFDGLPNDTNNLLQTLNGKGPFYFSDSVNGVVAGTLDGWQFNNPTGNDGTAANPTVEFRSQDGSRGSSGGPTAGGRGIVSFGANGSPERALGVVTTSAEIGNFGLLLVNNTPSIITDFTLSYTGELWRKGNVTTPDVLTFSFGMASSLADSGSVFMPAAALNFSGGSTTGYTSIGGTQVPVNGNDPANRIAISSPQTGFAWYPGETMVLRWAGQDLSGQDDGPAIDDLTFGNTSSNLTHIAGNFHTDSVLDGLDLQNMLKALSDKTAYAADNGLTLDQVNFLGDVNHDGSFDNGDIQPLLVRINQIAQLLPSGGAGSLNAVPEPASFALAAIGALGIALPRLRRRQKKCN
jgi:hypothetical protein